MSERPELSEAQVVALLNQCFALEGKPVVITPKVGDEYQGRLNFVSYSDEDPILTVTGDSISLSSVWAIRENV